MKALLRMSLVAAGLALAAPAFAGLNQNAKIFLHLGPVVAKNACTGQLPADCRNATVIGNVNSFYNVYVAVGNFSDSVGVAGCQYGIQYNDANSVGVDIFSWTTCSTLEFPMPNWPYLTNTGNLSTWQASDCKLGPAPAVAGFFYLGVYSPDRLALIPRPVDGRSKVASCASVEDDLTSQAPSPLGYVDFGTGPGYNPCNSIVPVAKVTWSTVKALLH